MPIDIPFSSYVEINPPRPQLGISDEDHVTFIPMSDVSESGQWINRQTRPFSEVKQGYTCFAQHDVLFAKITPCMENGKGCIVSSIEHGVGFASTEFHVLRAKSNAIPEFIYQWSVYQPLRLKAAASMTGSAGQQRVPLSFFDKYHIPEIAKPEQSKIAEILSTVDRAIEQTEALIAKQQRIKTGLMQDLLTRGIDGHGNLRSEETHEFKDSPLGRIPVEWEVSKVSALIKILNGGTPATSNKEYWAGGSIPWLSVEDFNNNKRFVDKAQKHITHKGLKNSATQILLKHSIIISARGTVGVIAQLGKDMAFNQSCYGLVSKDSKRIGNNYIYYSLIYLFSKKGVTTSGSVFDTITRKTFDEIYMPFASPKTSAIKQEASTKR